MFSKKIKLSLLLLTLAAAAQAQRTTVQGNIEGLSGPVIFNYSTGTARKADTVEVKNGKFRWEAKLSEPQKVLTYFSEQKEPFSFYFDKGKIRMTRKAGSPLTISGSSLQKEADAYYASTKELRNQVVAISQQIKNASRAEQIVLNEKQHRMVLQNLTRYIRRIQKAILALALLRTC